MNPHPLRMLVRARIPLLLALIAALAVAVTAANAHTGSSSVNCTSATINWTVFANSGSGNGGQNSPTWKITFTAAGGGTQVQSGQANFSGSSSTITKSLPGLNGTVKVETAWTSAQTRDGNSGSHSATYNLTNCGTAKLKLDKKVSLGDPGGTYTDSGTGHVGDTAYYKVQVSNTGTTDLSVTTTDFSKSCGSGTLYTTPQSTTAVTMPQTIAAGTSAAYYCKHVLTAADAAQPNSDYVNKACTSGTFQGTFTASGEPTDAALCDTVTVHILTPQIKVEKTTTDAVVHVGDTINYSVKVTNTGNASLTVTPSDTGCTGFNNAAFTLAPGAWKVLTCAQTAPDADSYTNQACATGTDSIGGVAGTVSHCDDVTTQVTHPGFTVSKSVDKPKAHIGETLTYTITAENTGDSVLHVSNFDDHLKGSGVAGCTFAAGAAPAATFDLQPGQKATFTCTHTVAASDPVPYTNVACFDATDGISPTPSTFSQCGETTTESLDHPAIGIDKTGPATAEAGQKLSYTLTVTNPGDVNFGEADVVVTDPVCNGDPVTLISKGADATPATLDPGDAWTYTCSVQTAVGDTAIHNVATVVATHPPLGPVQASDAADTTLTQPAQIVLPARITPGTARLTGQTGCAASAFNARVRGTKLAKVVFVLDGKVVKRVTANANTKTVSMRIDPRRLRLGVHRLVVNVTFQAGSGTKAKTLRLSFQRCSKKLATPRFTG